MSKKQAIYSFTPERNGNTAAGKYGDVTVFDLKRMTLAEIKQHGLEKYVKR